MTDISHFTMCQNWPDEQTQEGKKRANEARAIFFLLSKIQQFLNVDDVEFGKDPPDFVLRTNSKAIGIELVRLVPKPLTEKGGYSRMAEFKEWTREANHNPQRYQEFVWGEFTLRDSLESFRNQIRNKNQKLRNWGDNFSEKWLLMSMEKGAPFGHLFLQKEVETTDFAMNAIVKTLHSIFSICRNFQAWDYVILFAGATIIAFPKNLSNPHKLPVPRPDLVARGKDLADEILDCRCTLASILEFPGLSERP